MIYFGWKEWWSGNGVGGSGYATEINLLSMSPDDDMVAESWACDDEGNLNSSGGYGCFYVEDDATSSSISCTTPSGSCPSLAAINTFVGDTGESIVEDNGTSLADYGSVTIDYLGQDYQGNWMEYANSFPENITMVDSNNENMETTSIDYSSWDSTMTFVQAN